MCVSSELVCDSMDRSLSPVIELGVQQAYDLATRVFELTDLPPLNAIEYEDWGRDYLLSRLLAQSDEALAAAGLTRLDRSDRF